MPKNGRLSELPLANVRFARPTAKLAECRRFYHEVLGLPVIAEFSGHAGYDGVVIGLPDEAVQLELVHDGGAVPEPSPENQVVLYLGDTAAVEGAAAPVRAAGHRTVVTANPYWSDRGAVAFEDPDGWVVILAPWAYGQEG
ncbi:VOC family protein [Streptomyces tremellae]|uniref:VOC family protein n=1 Tax=Streptomyces tremellae TaxID=1124239 RepID=A0ABP7FVL1_9ACTN